MDQQLINKAKGIQNEIDKLAQDILVNRDVSVHKAYGLAESFVKTKSGKQEQVINNLLGTNLSEVGNE